MIYEQIVRKANKCYRFGTAGANADIFRHLDSVWAKGPDGKYNSSKEERYIALGEVCAFLRDSFERMIKSDEFSKEKKDTFQEMYDSLLSPSLERIDAAIDRYSTLQLV